MIIGELKVSPAEWDARFMRLAQEVSTWSKDPEVKVGAVVVSADKRQYTTGYNGFLPGVTDTKERLRSDERVPLTAHAEFNACNNINHKSDYHGGTIFTTRAPCIECAKSIAHPLLRLERVVTFAPDPNSSWYPSSMLAFKMLREIGVTVDVMS